MIKLLFIHHSTGANLIAQGNLRKLLKEKSPNIEFWDHSYNLLPLWQITARVIPYYTGLCDKDGKLTGTDYKIKITNTDPQGYADLFSQEISWLAEYDIIMFKSCFPVTKIETDEQLQHYKDRYLKIRESIDKLPNKKFFLFTPPPLRAEMTKPEYAQRARNFANWLKSIEYLGERKNMVTFDFFDFLADKDNFLKKDYCPLIPFDSHPNKRANQEVAKELVNFINRVTK